MTDLVPVCIAAVLALLLAVLAIARRDAEVVKSGGMIARGCAVLLAFGMAVAPPLFVQTGSLEASAALMFYVVFFAVFCYYKGWAAGRTVGRKEITELLGLDSPDQIADTQDRLFESRLRFPLRMDVVKSIGDLAQSIKDDEPVDAPVGESAGQEKATQTDNERQ